MIKLLMGRSFPPIFTMRQLKQECAGARVERCLRTYTKCHTLERVAQ